uniref:Cellular nucleic acid-binding protein n=1 Tax=Anthurium amnicola TaxID=1678845 RepID=A0A1D1Y402_9ARAE
METAVVVSDDEGEDEHLLSLVAAAEASALATKRRKLQTPVPPAGAPSGGGAVEEGSYTAALRGSRSALWQQQQQQQRRGGREGFNPVGGGGRRGPPPADFDGHGAGVASAAGSCFKCGQAGHWARDCGGMRGGGGVVESGLGSEGDAPRKACPCGLGDCPVLTSNTARNPGRKFYRCPVKEENGGCKFFEWCDNPASGFPASRSFSNCSSPVPELPCPCGAGSCLVLTAKTEKNIGQQFYRCPLDQGGGSCGFFKWCNQYKSLADPLPTESLYNTSNCRNYQSAEERSVSYCFKCGQGGHWARDCPKNELDSRANIGGNSSASSGSCFRCGEVGHWARNCPSQDAALSAGRGKGLDSSRGSCLGKSK